ncbi:archaellin sugar biosynthesis putative threonine transferase AglU [Methanococcus maripaludis]|uniref:Asparagine synthetase B (Glutamine-hydrolyzing) n=1 Tax=Methanococcus maripaludis TaxID=39152 RepID=A0A7J9PSP5_METMI|nr:archaellin sugar biosynthesis putative threonine transferase AglU [Methanococcus maripaludis]MBA2868488.1 asparagine synthetase B (glutamine-hydrolyzing) [Methanococcus maripaludis]
MPEIYFEYYKNTKISEFKSFKPNFKFYVQHNLFKKSSEKYMIYFYDFDWKKDSVIKNDLNDYGIDKIQENISNTQISILNGEILPKKKRFDPEDTENITYGAFNIVNIDENSIKIYNDIFSMIPLYYYADNDIFIFSTKMKPIIERLKSLSKTLTEDNVGKYLSASCGYFIGDYTFFKEIKYLKQGIKITIDLKSNEISFSRYYTYNYTKKYKKESMNEEKFAELFDIFDDSQKTLLSNYSKNTGLMISGGLDSRYILAKMDKLNIKPFLLNMGHENSAETKLAIKIANLSNNTNNLTINELTEDNIIKNAEEYYKINEGFENFECDYLLDFKDWAVNNNVRYLYNGYFGDCLLGGTLYARRNFDIRSIFDQIVFLKDLIGEINTKEDCINLILKNLGISKEKALKEQYEDFKEIDLRKIVEKEIDLIMNEIKYENYLDVYLHFQFLTRAHRHVLNGCLATRSFSEFIHPFFAYRMFETALKVDDSLKTQHHMYKKYLIDRFPKYARINKSGWGVDCYKSAKVCKFGEYYEAFKNKMINLANNKLEKPLIKMDTYYDATYWYYDSEEFRKFLKYDLQNGFMNKHIEYIEKYYNIKYK